MIRFSSSEDIRSWGGVLQARHNVARPQWRDELPEVLAVARHSGSPILATGLRRSYGDTGLNPDGAILDMTALDRAIFFDPDSGILRAEAGVSFDMLLKMLIRRGFFLPVTPGTRFVTLGGAIANDVHGKNHHSAGTLGRWVRRIGLLRSDGLEIELTPQENTGLFGATIGGLGLTGVITWAEIETVRIASAIMDVENIPFENLDEFFQIARQSDGEYEYTVAWVDCLAKGKDLGRGLFTRGNHASKGARLPTKADPKLTIPFNFPSLVLNKLSLGAFNSLYYWKGKRNAGGSKVPIHPFFYPLDSIGHWYRMYGRRGMYQYQSAVPPESERDATKAMLELISAAGEGSFLAVLKTFGDKSSLGMLSFPRPGTTLALDFPNRGSSTLRLMGRLDAIVREAGGRLYPAKDGRMPADMFRAGYPHWQDFAKYIDPAFESHFWRRVGQ
ncbi:FAD-binding oxidoreductase (plasmid) [Rhizobium sp. CB3090]|uniref:FAD-binding oxidoreductase n=1 Tax=Rhizobium sp. CB3090 TaxID=3039156 RepID=UPI0024B19DFD|nr:FAD-binding oxidoreductase [Rhizobium sp. CB3090]WFU12171.1 FAD-binding oxidoreductase [Rhizobium sp. CB3090]